MIDKLASKIKKYPFQIGIIAGIILCLLISLIAGLFQDHGKTLSGNIDLIQEDYLRMAISEYSENNDAQLAAWRYKHLGSKADQVLARMRADSGISAKELVAFADAIQKRGAIDMEVEKEVSEGSPANPKRGLSTFAKILLILMGIGILAAAGLYLYSKYNKNPEQKKWSGKLNELFTHKKPVRMVYPEENWQEEIPMDEIVEDEGMFNLDQMFSGADKGVMNKKSAYEPVQETPAKASRPTRSPIRKDRDNEENDTQDMKPIVPPENEEDNSRGEETASIPVNGFHRADTLVTQRNAADVLSSPFEASDSISTPEPDYAEANDLPREENDHEDWDENPLLTTDETDIGVETDAEPVQNYHADLLTEENPVPSQLNDDAYTQKTASSGTATHDDIKLSSREEETEEGKTEGSSVTILHAENPADGENTGLLIHFQSRYTIGNDMYDEVFSIEQDDNVFRGECGIGIGETLNNTEPKAVTAFEVWLFDRDDIHTATQYLLSDFAQQNEGISSRLNAHGRCNPIRKDCVYTIETQSLSMDLKVLEVEYGTETEEQRAYFRNVLFDICVREKGVNAG